MFQSLMQEWLVHFTLESLDTKQDTKQLRCGPSQLSALTGRQQIQAPSCSFSFYAPDSCTLRFQLPSCNVKSR